MRTPDFAIDLPDPKVRMRNIQVFVTPKNWLAKLLQRFFALYEIECTWYEEPLG